MTDKPIRVLLADDQPLLRTGFKMVLGAETDLDIVGEAGNGAEAVDLARRLLPDVVLMDIRMPRLDGVAATRAIVDAKLPVRVLIQLARGQSNAEIARELSVSETTVKTHVGHVLTKLGLRDRVQAVVLAYETGLVRPGS